MNATSRIGSKKSRALWGASAGNGLKRVVIFIYKQSYFHLHKLLNSIKELPVIFPTTRGLFCIVFDELTGARKRDLCPGLKWTLIQPPSVVMDNACETHAPCIVS